MNHPLRLPHRSRTHPLRLRQPPSRVHRPRKVPRHDAPTTPTRPTRVCGNHVTVLCEHCLDLIVDHVRRTFAHTRAGGPPPACPVCGMPFTHIHHIVQEVENL